MAVQKATHQQIDVVVDVSDGVDSGTVNSSEVTKMEDSTVQKDASLSVVAAEVTKHPFEERAL